jgi:hypothetical protein
MMAHRLGAAFILMLGGLALGEGARAQCMLANPSFETPGTSGVRFQGWNQFGVVSLTPLCSHGATAAIVRGPDTGTWNVSGYWQRLDTQPGQQWFASVVVAHSSAQPLTGQSQAIVNIEWRDVNGALISYESHVAATPSTPTNAFQVFSVTSQPAPAGAVATHFLLGVLQSPTDPVPEVTYDQATFYNLGPPTHQEQQWLDCPGGRTINFGARTWRVKGPGFYGPGPNSFSDAASATWVDALGRLHMTIQKVGNVWYSTEVILEEALGYGDYIFTTRGRLDTLDPHGVLGMFLWEYGACYNPADAWWNPYNEIDIEFSRWNVPGNPIGQYVAQPYDAPGNIFRFDRLFTTDEVTSHAFRWLPNRVEFRSWRGGPADESPSTLTSSWTYNGQQLPRPEEPRVHVNLWQFAGSPSTNQEVVFDSFTFLPPCSTPPCGIVAVGSAEDVRPRLEAPGGIVFRANATIHYVTETSEHVTMVVYDLQGRRTRTLVSGMLPAGQHDIVWDGRDDAGHRVSAGMYVCRVRSSSGTALYRMVLAR